MNHYTRRALWILTACTVLFAAPAHAGKRDLVIALGGDVAWPHGWFDANTEKVGNGPGMFARIADYLAGADLRFCNLETPLSHRSPAVRKKYMIVTPPERLAWLTGAGFNLLSLANNHAADAGVAGLQDTLATLEAARRSGRPLWWAGAHPDPARATEPLVFTPPGKTLRVALIAVGNNRSRMVASFSARSVEARIRKVRALADLVIVSFHAGTEYQHVAEPRLVARAHRFVDAGADLVVGHHPHVVRGVERYKGGFIFYSLGNFSFASYTNRHHKTGARMYGMLPLVTVIDGHLSHVRIVPLYVNNKEPWRLKGQPVLRPTPFQPQPLTGAYAQAMLGELQDFSDAIAGNTTRLQIRGDEGHVDLAGAVTASGAR